MKTLLIIICLIAILFAGCETEEQGVLSAVLPDSIGAGAMFIDLDSRAGNVRGVTPMVFGIWNIDK